jgi:isopentenyl-diphosphate delta-isomerase
VPVIAKEVGFGIAEDTARQLASAGVAAIDIAGAGGTSWAAVERTAPFGVLRELAEAFWDWGIPTVASLIETTQRVHIPVIASGGIRSGTDMAKALALGASLTGVAYPILGPAVHGAEAVEKKLRFFIEGLRNAMFLVGADSVQRLQNVSVIVTGKMLDWLTMRGFDLQTYARRSL